MSIIVGTPSQGTEKCRLLVAEPPLAKRYWGAPRVSQDFEKPYNDKKGATCEICHLEWDINLQRT